MFDSNYFDNLYFDASPNIIGIVFLSEYRKFLSKVTESRNRATLQEYKSSVAYLSEVKNG